MNKKKSKKILYVITKSNWGGAQQYVFELATNLAKESYVTEVALGGNGILKTKLEEDGIPTISIKSLERDVNFKKDFAVFRELFQIFKLKKPAVIHLNSSKIAGLGSLAGYLYKLYCYIHRKPVPRIIFTAHGWAFNENRSVLSKKVMKGLYWLILILSDHVIAVSKKTKADVSSFPLISSAKISVLYNGIEPFEIQTQEKARHLLAPHIPEKIWIGTISELHSNKGLDYLINAFREIVTTHSNVALVIIGEGEERKSLEMLIQKNNLKEKVFLLGRIENARSYLNAFSIFTLTSRTEAFPYVLLEAGNASCPVIASRVGGIPEIIEDKKTGLLFQKGDIPSLVNNIILLLNDEDTAALLGKNLKKRVKESFTQKHMLEQTQQIYEK